MIIIIMIILILAIVCRTSTVGSRIVLYEFIVLLACTVRSNLNISGVYRCNNGKYLNRHFKFATVFLFLAFFAFFFTRLVRDQFDRKRLEFRSVRGLSKKKKIWIYRQISEPNRTSTVRTQLEIRMSLLTAVSLEREFLVYCSFVCTSCADREEQNGANDLSITKMVCFRARNQSENFQFWLQLRLSIFKFFEIFIHLKYRLRQIFILMSIQLSIFRGIIERGIVRLAFSFRIYSVSREQLPNVWTFKVTLFSH